MSNFCWHQGFQWKRKSSLNGRNIRERVIFFPSEKSDLSKWETWNDGEWSHLARCAVYITGRCGFGAANTMMCGCNGSEIGQFPKSPPLPKNNSHEAAGADGEKVINSLGVMEAVIGLLLSSPRTCFKSGWIVSAYKKGVGWSQVRVCTLYRFKETIWLLLGLNLITYWKAADAGHGESKVQAFTRAVLKDRGGGLQVFWSLATDHSFLNHNTSFTIGFHSYQLTKVLKRTVNMHD